MSLLSIPRELRDEIINLLINTSPLPLPSTTNLHPGNRRQRVYPPERFSAGSNILYEPLPHRTSSSLLLVSHQLRTETLTALHRLPNPTIYILDILLYQECQLWPTWLSLPKLSTKIDKIYTTFRIAGFPPAPTEERRGLQFTGFTQGCGGPPWIEWCFLELWKDLLGSGPTGKARMPSGVKLLELDVISPDENLPVAPVNVDPGDLSELRESSGLDYILNPLSIVGIIASGLRILLSVEHYAEQYGGCLYEGLGTVRLLHDGILVQEWNITEMFENLRFVPETDSRIVDESYDRVHGKARLEAFEKWKNGIAETRMQVGLLERKTEDGVSASARDLMGQSSKGKDDVARMASPWKVAMRKAKALLSLGRKG